MFASVSRTSRPMIAFLCLALLTASTNVHGQVCGAWHVVPSPSPGSGSPLLLALAVASPNDAFAIGSISAGLRWNGSVWNEVAFPDLSGLGTSFVVDDVTVTPSGKYWFSGAIVLNPLNGVPLAMRYDSGWDEVAAVELAPMPVEGAPPRNGRARAISALNDSDIWAVGSATGDGTGVGGPRPLTLHWDGSDWTEVPAPAVGDRINDLYDVVMIAPDDVWAVGRWRDICCQSVALTLHWDGSSWNHVPNPAEAIGGTELKSVTAIASNDVWAVGWRPSDALLMHWDGSSWSVFQSPVPVSFGMSTVAALASDDVWAAGGNLDHGFFHWDGSTWGVVAAPLPAATSVTRGGELAAVGACDMWSVGRWTVDGVAQTLTERLQVVPTQVGPSARPEMHVTITMSTPYDPGAGIAFVAPVAGFGHARIFDARGRTVWANDLGYRDVGPSRIAWDGRTRSGVPLSPGVYFVRIEIGSMRGHERLLLMQ